MILKRTPSSSGKYDFLKYAVGGKFRDSAHGDSAHGSRPCSSLYSFHCYIVRRQAQAYAKALQGKPLDAPLCTVFPAT